MLDHRIRLRHLRCFLETAQLGSLSAAARVLRISQPAASKTIRELEDILGRALFDRAARRLSLTSAGRIFQQHTGAALIELSRAQDLLQDAARQLTRISVGVLPTAATELMPRAALAFHAERPNCLMRVTTGPNWLLMSQLRDGSLDLVVGRMGLASVMEGLSFRPLYSEPIYAVVRPDHPLLLDPQAAENLVHYALVLPPPGAVIGPIVRAYLARRQPPTRPHAFETVSLAFGRKLVQASDAVWFISRGVVANELAVKALVAVDIGEDLLGSPVGISMREDGLMSPEQRSLVNAIERAAKTGLGL